MPPLIAIPANVRQVCATLTKAGFEAVAVGGAVRDALLGRAPGDWDVATSAHPDDVLKLFTRCIPTGLQHGTVTIVTGHGEASHVEVTTYRGDGAYTDGRRPDNVTFGVPLVEDLARRDLCVNAMAYDPERDVLHDPFDGRGDIARKLIRAVGDPVARFSEDGLRVMRAVRFAASLEFGLDPATVAAIPSALAVLGKVSRERVCEELRKILDARLPSLALVPARTTGIIAVIAPVLASTIKDTERWAEIVDVAPRRARLAALMLPIGNKPTVEKLLRELKFSNDELRIAAPIVGAIVGAALTPVTTEIDVRRMLSPLGRELAPIAAEVLTAAGAASAAVARTIVERGDPLVASELAVGGKDLMEAGIAAGPGLGKAIATLLAAVLDDPARNTRDQLLALALT
ncbi:MAG: hypothetical protein NT062_16130 [Proteobacteria bacterium]|nr:hypothetical protein [Pseudomonadota bacterium]